MVSTLDLKNLAEGKREKERGKEGVGGREGERGEEGSEIHHIGLQGKKIRFSQKVS